MRGALALFPLLVACGGGSGDLVFMPENNFTFSGELDVQTTQVQALADSTIDWSGLTTDLRDRPFDGSVDQVMLVEFLLSKEEILEKSVKNDLFQSDSQQQYLFDPDPSATSMQLSEFEIIGNLFDPTTQFPQDDSRNWLVSITDLPDGRLDILMSKFVEPRDDSTNTAIDLLDGDTVLTFDVDLSSMPPIVTKEGAGPYTLDWSAVKKDVNGKDFDSLLGDELIIAHYADAAGPGDIEAGFLQLDTNATALYRLSAYGVTDAELEEATDEGGNSFDGFTTDGVWLVGIACTTCTSPVPFLIATVEVE